MAPLEPWEKVLIVAEDYAADKHSSIACTQCHKGEQAADKDTAHTGLVARPSDDPTVCGMCHAQIAEAYPNSLHASLQGYWTVLDARSVPESHPALETMFGNHCAGCHTACGDCHVSQPRSVGGGFIDGHVFNRTPSLTRNCTACHGSRVGNEFMGKNEGYKADVHFRQGRMKCTDCHTGAELHGTAEGLENEHRYAGPQTPTCESCHEAVGAAGDDNPMHTVHGTRLSCQVCHSITYTSCDGCHVALSESTGNPFFSTEGAYPTFYIGRNTRQDENRPYEFVPVRHVPIAPTSFEFYGENLLSNFLALPTWVYATPHNIQRETPQNESCEACHGHPELFLTAEKVAEAELEANLAVIVAFAPPPLGQGTQSSGPAMPANHEGLNQCLICHSKDAGAPVLPENHAGYTDGNCSMCHTEYEK